MMWPFNKADLPGIKEDGNGVLIELSDEEQQAVKEQLDHLRGRTEEGEWYWKNDIADEIQRVVTSEGLLFCAMKEAVEFEDSRNKDVLQRALASILKAYLYYPLPIHIGVDPL